MSLLWETNPIILFIWKVNTKVWKNTKRTELSFRLIRLLSLTALSYRGGSKTNLGNIGHEAVIHPGCDASPLQGTMHTDTLIHPYGQFILANLPTGMSSGGERKPDNSEKTHIEKRAQKLHTDSSNLTSVENPGAVKCQHYTLHCHVALLLRLVWSHFC